MKRIEKTSIGLDKTKDGLENFNKIFQKGTKLGSSYVDMMSALPKLYSKLSTYSKMEFIPKKEVTKIEDTVKMFEGMLKSLQGKVDLKAMAGLEIVFDSINKNVKKIETGYDKTIYLTTDLNKLIKEVSGSQKELSTDSEKYLTSTKSVKHSYSYIKGELNSISKEMQQVKESGSVSTVKLKEYQKRLKSVHDKLKPINKKFEEEKRIKEGVSDLESKSLSGQVKKVRQQHAINKAYAKQKGGIEGLGFSLSPKNLQTASVAKLGTTGVVAGKAMTAAFAGLSDALAPLAMFSSAGALIKGMFNLERQTKNARKQMFMLAMDTHSGAKAFDEMKSGTELVDTDIEKMRKRTQDFVLNLGLSADQVADLTKEFAAEGFALDDTLSGFENIISIGAAVGISIDQVSKRAGDLRTEYGLTLGQIGDAFVSLDKQAKDAGMTTNRFFDRVMNAAVGLALYGQKVDLVGSTFSKLIKGMKLPENVASKAAADLTQGFSHLNDAMKITTFQQGKGKELWEEYYDKMTTANKKRREEIDAELGTSEVQSDAAKKHELEVERAATLQDDADNRRRNNTKDLAGDLLKIEKMDTGRQLTAQLNAVGSKFATNFNGNIRKVSKNLNDMFLHFRLTSETFGIGEEGMTAIRNMIDGIDTNIKALDKVGADLNQPEGTNEIIKILSSSEKKEIKSVKIQDIIRKMTKKGGITLGKLKEELLAVPDLHEGINNLTDVSEKGLSDVITDLSSKFDVKAELDKKLADKGQTTEAKLVGKQMMQQTRSTEDAINNTITNILRNLFTLFERFVNLFSFINKSETKKFDEMNKTLDENKKIAQKRVDNARSLENSIDFKMSQTDDPKQLADLQAQKDASVKLRQSNEDSVDKLSKLQTALTENGKLTKEQTDAVQKVSLPYEAAKLAGKPMQWGNPDKKAKGGIVGGNSMTGDKILTALNSGELVVPQNIWKNSMTPAMSPTMNTGMSGGSSGTTVNDHRSFVLNINQRDERYIKQLILNTMYNDKLPA